ncbi:phage major capsid protein [Streptomyces noursei]|nr:phage major capsid protein [Streptomyces noursei]
MERFERMATLASVDRSQIITTTNTGDGDQAERDARYAAAFQRYMRQGMERLNGEDRELLMTGFSQIRALGTSPDTAAGYLVPDTFRGTMTETMKAFGGLLNICNVISTSDGADLWWPTNDDTGNEGALLSEAQEVPEQDLTIGRRELGAFTFTSSW